MLQIQNLSFDYPDVSIFNNINFIINLGDLIHLQGANGTGKTTLLKLLSGLYRPVSGKLLFNEHSIYEQLNEYQSQLCYVGHKPGLSPHLTIKENCLFDVHYNNQSSLEDLADVFNLGPFLERYCGMLSSGQLRKVSLLRLWFTKANLWLLDEPFVALDKYAQNILMAKIETHCTNQGMVILTSHQHLPTDKTYKEYHL